MSFMGLLGERESRALRNTLQKDFARPYETIFYRCIAINNFVVQVDSSAHCSVFSDGLMRSIRG